MRLIFFGALHVGSQLGHGLPVFLNALVLRSQNSFAPYSFVNLSKIIVADLDYVEPLGGSTFSAHSLLDHFPASKNVDFP